MTHYHCTLTTLRRDTQRGSDQSHPGAQLRKTQIDDISTSCVIFFFPKGNGQRPKSGATEVGRKENRVTVKTETTRMLNNNHNNNSSSCSHNSKSTTMPRADGKFSTEENLVKCDLKQEKPWIQQFQIQEALLGKSLIMWAKSQL